MILARWLKPTAIEGSLFIAVPFKGRIGKRISIGFSQKTASMVNNLFGQSLG